MGVTESPHGALGRVWLGQAPPFSEWLQKLFAGSHLGYPSTIESGDIVVLHVDHESGRGATSVSRALSETLTFPLSEAPAVVLLSWRDSLRQDLQFLSTASAVWIQCPLLADATDGLIARVTKAPPLPLEEWRALVERALLTELEWSARTIRHRFAGMAAAVRVYLGALMAGRAAIDQSLRVLASLAQSAAAARVTEIQIDPAHFVKVLAHYRQLIGRPPIVPLRATFSMLDDGVDRDGWRAVLDQIANVPLQAFIAWDGEDGFKAALQNDGGGDVLLLDCNLGVGPTGLECLRSIRSVRPELQIVFMTAYDDAQVALWALRTGANQFFAKQLRDRDDRNSLDYFEQFTQLTEQSDLHARVRTCWRVFETRVPITARPSSIGGPLDTDAVQAEAFLRLAFYLLFSYLDGAYWWAWGAPDLLRLRSADAGDELGRLVVLAVATALPELKDTPRYGRLVKDVRHGKTATLDAALRMLEDVIGDMPERSRLTVAPAQPDLPKGCPYNPDDLRTDSDLPGVTFGVRQPSHQERDDEGAIDLELGNTIMPHDDADRGADILVIDDSPQWTAAVASVWPDAMISNDGNVEPKDLARASCVLLDLCLPSVATGLKTLESIKAADPALPVIAVSAVQESLLAIRAMRRGAIDYVSKRLPRARDDEQIAQFARDIRVRVDVARIICRQLRPMWNRYFQQRRHVQPRLPALTDRCRVLTPSANQIAPPPDFRWVEAVEPDVRFLLATWQSFESRRIGRQTFVPLDEWRASEMLQLSDVHADGYIAWMAVGIVERLAQWQYCLRYDRAIYPTEWGGARIEIAEAVKTALGPPGLKIWDIRMGFRAAAAVEVIDLLLQAIDAYRASCEDLERATLWGPAKENGDDWRFAADVERTLLSELRTRWNAVVVDGRIEGRLHILGRQATDGACTWATAQLAPGRRVGTRKVSGEDLSATLFSRAREGQRFYVSYDGEVRTRRPQEYELNDPDVLWIHVAPKKAPGAAAQIISRIRTSMRPCDSYAELRESLEALNDAYA